MLLFTTAYKAVRRAMEEDQRRPRYPDVPLWRLLLEEIAVLARRVGRWRVTLVVAVVAAAVVGAEVVLSEMTPGPVLGSPWRWLVAGAVAVAVLVAWAVMHAMTSTRDTVAEGR